MSNEAKLNQIIEKYKATIEEMVSDVRKEGMAIALLVETVADNGEDHKMMARIIGDQETTSTIMDAVIYLAGNNPLSQSAANQVAAWVAAVESQVLQESREIISGQFNDFLSSIGRLHPEQHLQ